VTQPFPGELRELEFVEAYWRAALKKPQMAADAALRALVFSDAGDRAILTGLIAQELAEACRRLVAVHGALGDRRYAVARTLLKPLPGVAEWKLFIQQAATFNPEQMLRELSLGEEALAQAEELRGLSDLADLSGLIAAAETGNAMLLIPGGRQVADACWLAGIDVDGTPVASSFGTSESDATGLADLVADICGIARGFLGAYLGHRHSAGRRD
jgi:hypothetical protein